MSKASAHVIVSAGEDDLPEIRSMIGSSGDGPQWSDLIWATMAQPMADSAVRRLSLIARDEAGTLAGWLTGTVVGEVAEIEFLFVKAEQRKRGFGKALLDSWRTKMKQAGALEVFLEVRSSNMKAVQCYSAAGFELKGTRRRYYKNPNEDALVMRLLL